MLKRSILLLLFSLFSFVNSWSCYYYWSHEYYRYSVFNNELGVDCGEGFTAYTWDLDYADYYDKKDCDLNPKPRGYVLQWYNELKELYTYEELDTLLYGTSSGEFTFLTPVLEKPLVKRMLDNPKYHDYLNYYFVLKRVELQYGFPDKWGDENDLEFNLDEVIEKKIKEVKNPFLLERYFYQLIVVNYYKREYGKVTELVEEHFLNNKNKDILDYSALEFYVRAVYRNNQKRKSIGVLKELFLNSSLYHKRFAYKAFDVDSLPLLAKTKEEIVASDALAALKYKGRAFSHFKRIYRGNPYSRFLPLILVREINKIEDYIYTIDHYRSISSEESGRDWEFMKEIWKMTIEVNKGSDLKYLKEITFFLERVDYSKVYKPNVFRLAVLYGKLLTAPISETDKYLKYLKTKYFNSMKNHIIPLAQY